MKRKILALVSAVLCLMVLWGCQKAEPEETTEPEATEVMVLATAPADGNPDDVTCKGSYGAERDDIDADAVVATVGDAKLTNGELAVWYHGAIARYRQEGHEENPDFEADLDLQECQADGSVNSWQQYFLREALNDWHTAQALEVTARTDKIVTEEAFHPDPEQESYMAGMPVTEYLYGYKEYFEPNSMHQAYLDAVPQMLDTLAKEKGFADEDDLAEKAFGAEREDLEAVAKLYNYGYMYFTQLTYTEEPEEAEEKTEEISAKEERLVDIRHILLVPQSVTDRKGNVTDPVTVAEDGAVTCSENLWNKNGNLAKKLLREWKNPYKNSEKDFREMAYRESDDAASSENGGIYRRIRQGQLITELDRWCFDETRKVGDTTIIRTKLGDHILYFAGSKTTADVQSEQEQTKHEQKEIIAGLKERFPAKIDYSKIQLSRAEAAVSLEELLYPDVAHERYPELPLYLQQAYGSLKFGNDLLYSHGCGITSFSLVSSYMMDKEYTPPEMAAQFRRYNSDGTDGMIFINEPETMGYYMEERTFDPDRVLEALREGKVVISLQGKGYWTNGGHYITLEKLTEDDWIQVRDTHMINYKRIEDHKLDKHEQKNVFGFSAGGYWIMQKKVRTIPFCSRCGDGEDASAILQNGEYLCEKCETSLIRRNVWLES